MGTILALAAAVLYGSADFLGGAAARRARPLAVLAITTPAGAVITVAAAVAASAAGLGGHGLPGPAGLAWAPPRAPPARPACSCSTSVSRWHR